MENFDVTVIGAGLAGLYCARQLAGNGLKVLLVDRRHNLAQKIHTTGIFVRKTLEDFEFPPNCLGPVINNVSLYAPSGRAIHLRSDHDEFRIGRMGHLYQHYLTDCLDLGVCWRPATTYQDFNVQTATLRLSDGLVRTRYLIGADGSCSRVAVDLQLDQNTRWIVGLENVFANVRIDSEPRLFCFLDPEIAPGYIAWIAWDGEEMHVGVGGDPNRFDPATALQKLQSRITSIIDLRREKPIERRGGRIPVGGILRRIANAHGLLIGDAAGAVSPLTAGGLDPCLRLTEFAANVVTNFLDTGDERFLSQYSGAPFRARFTSRLWARRAISSLRAPIYFELLCMMLRLPLVDRLAHHVFFGRGSFPDVDDKYFTSRFDLALRFRNTES